MSEGSKGGVLWVWVRGWGLWEGWIWEFGLWGGDGEGEEEKMSERVEVERLVVGEEGVEGGVDDIVVC